MAVNGFRVENTYFGGHRDSCRNMILVLKYIFYVAYLSNINIFNFPGDI